MYRQAICLCLLLCFAKGDGRKAATCPGGLEACECVSNHVNCSATGLATIPSELTFDLGVEYFYFDNNNLIEVKANHFTNYVDMSYLSARKNKIKTIESKALDSNTKLETIDFSYNELTYIPVHLFRKLTKLASVYLDHNKLAKIQSEHFMHLESLVDVRMENNLLTSIGKDAFINSHGLHSLYLENNKLEIPEKNWFAAFNNHAENYEVYLDENEWSCDCRMLDFYRWGSNHPWFMHHDGEGVSVPRCHFPNRLRGTTLAKISSESELTCTPVTVTFPSAGLEIKTTEGQRVNLTCKATGFPLPTVTIKDQFQQVMTTSKGTTTHWIKPVTLRDAGLYSCIASGYNKSGDTMTVTAEIRLKVFRSPGSVATIVIISLFLVGLSLGLAVWFYKKKLRKRFSYGRLPNNSVYYEKDNVASSATYNAESIRTPAGEPPAPTRVENPYLDYTDSAEDEDEDNVEYSKDTEFLV